MELQDAGASFTSEWERAVRRLHDIARARTKDFVVSVAGHQTTLVNVACVCKQDTRKFALSTERPCSYSATQLERGASQSCSGLGQNLAAMNGRSYSEVPR